MAQLLIFASRLANLLTGGSPRELFCTRAWRNNWTHAIYAIDAIYGAKHCRASYAWDRRYNGRPR